MPTTWYIQDNFIADPAYVKVVSPYSWTGIFNDRKVYSTEAAADTDAATLQATDPTHQGRFGVHAHNH